MTFLSQYAADAFPVPDLVESYGRQAKGIPIGRAAEVNLRNNHAQYIFTWLVKTLAPARVVPFASPVDCANALQVWLVSGHIDHAVDARA